MLATRRNTSLDNEHRELSPTGWHQHVHFLWSASMLQTNERRH
jgi:hypothetical protein